MIFRFLNAEDHDAGLSNVPITPPEKIVSFYQQKNELTHKIGTNLNKNLQKYIIYDDNFDKIRAGGSISAKDRGRVWQELSNSDSLHLETFYQQLIREPTPYKQLIQRDITRTFPNSEMFSQESGQKAMERILHAYSLYDDEINYCQGLAFLIGPLLMNMAEEQAFSVFVRLMETHGMRTMFTQSMEGLHLRLYQFDCLLQEFLPDIYLFFKEHGVNSQMYISPWFLTLFAYVLPMDLVMRIYDLVFLQGAAIETMMRVALSLLMRVSPHIMSLGDFEEIVTFLSSKKIITDDDCFIQDSLQLCGYVTRTKLDQLQEKYEQKKRKENSFLKVDSSNSLVEKSRYDDGLLVKPGNSKKKTKKMMKNWFSTISNNKSKVFPPKMVLPPKSSSRSPILKNNNNTMLLHQQIEDLVAALSLVQKENISLKSDLYDQATRTKSHTMFESRIKQLSNDLQEMTADRNLQLQEKEEAKQQVDKLRKQLNRLNDYTGNTFNARSVRSRSQGLRRSESIVSDASSSSSSCSSIENDGDTPHLSLSPLLLEKSFSPSIVPLHYKSSDII